MKLETVESENVAHQTSLEKDHGHIPCASTVRSSNNLQNAQNVCGMWMLAYITNTYFL